jgi:hypothetical protein
MDLLALLNPERLYNYINGFFYNYRLLREQLKPLADITTVINGFNFFPEVRHLVWFIALDALIVQMAETLFYLFFLVLIIGLASWTTRLKSDRRVAYLWILSLSAFALLYAQIIYNWVLTSRFLALFLFPAFIFMGAGIERMTGFLSSRCRLRGNWGNAAMVLLILAFLLPKNWWANFEPDKLVFREIANYIVGREHFTRPISVCGAFKRVRVIHFFANVDYPGAPCLEAGTILKQTDEKELKQIPMRGFDYFVWNQDNWKNLRIESLPPDIANHFLRLREWPSGRVGKLVLYKVIK